MGLDGENRQRDAVERGVRDVASGAHAAAPDEAGQRRAALDREFGAYPPRTGVQGTGRDRRGNPADDTLGAGKPAGRRVPGTVRLCGRGRGGSGPAQSLMTEASSYQQSKSELTSRREREIWAHVFTLSLAKSKSPPRRKQRDQGGAPARTDQWQFGNFKDAIHVS